VGHPLVGDDYSNLVFLGSVLIFSDYNLYTDIKKCPD
jgi:hypothetical protein